MKIKLLIILTLSITLLNAQTKKVLFLGNSFTYTYDIPNLFNQLATNAGFSVLVDSYTQAGIAVANEQVTGHINDPLAQAKISSQPWDFVVVQDNMGNYVNSAGIPSACGNANVTLYNQIKANNICTRIIYFSGWGPSGGVFSGDNTQACIDRIFTNMLFLNNNIGDEIVTPIGKAWNSSLSLLPSVNLYHSDNVHPSLEGSYLAAASIFTSIFKRNPSGLTYNGDVAATTAQTMRNIAYTTVSSMPNYTLTLLSNYTPIITVNSNTLISSGASSSSFQWSLNGIALTGATSKTLVAAASGTYAVVLTNTVGCTFASWPTTLTVIATGLDNAIAENLYNMYPNPSTGILNLNFEDTRIHFIEIKNMLGQTVKVISSNETSLFIDLTGIEDGMYFITVDKTTSKRWVKNTIY